MKHKVLATLLILCFGLISTAHARPDMTPEQIAKARETALQMKPPVDFDFMLDEADRLGVECTGDLTRRSKIWNCSNLVEIAQSKERQAKLDEESKRLDEESKRLDEEAVRLVNEAADIAEQKLQQIK
ncbi:hypothetical protein LJC41_01330 [Desulfosarcina sp. OttesenSCG-928-G17]|nr:hypothetical protein [Desulfosarcina sp. OttesenSCG-928-G17]